MERKLTACMKALQKDNDLLLVAVKKLAPEILLVWLKKVEAFCFPLTADLV